MAKIGIIGSGFGLYGYLPALLEVSDANEIFLVERYREKLSSRSELKKYLKNINWVKSEDNLLQISQKLVIAVNPSTQEFYMDKILMEKNNISEIFLEKPIACTPKKTQEYCYKLFQKNIKIRVGYLFRYTSWASQLIDRCKMAELGSSIEMKWSFKAHHYKENIETWKRDQDSGGGVIAFYGIHVLALLAEIGYNDIVDICSTKNIFNEAIAWKAVFIGKNLTKFKVSIDTNSDSNKFQVIESSNHGAADITVLTDLSDPFDSMRLKIPGMDKRIDPLAKHINSMNHDDALFFWYERVNDLWTIAHKFERQ